MFRRPTRVVRAALFLAAACLAAAPPIVAQTRPPGARPPAKPAARPAAAPVAAADRLDAVAASVNDDVVMQSDVEEQLYLFLMRSGAQPDSTQVDTLRRSILDQLINEKLIVAEAKRQGVGVTDAEVNGQVEQAIREAKERMGGDDGFRQQLAKENLTEARLREKYKGEVTRQLLAQKVVQKQFPRRPVPQTEAETYFAAHKERFPRFPGQVRLSIIQIPPTPDSQAVLAGRARIDAARKRIVAGEKFAKVAAEVSEDPGSARAGGDLGYFARGQMEPSVEQAAFEGRIGTVSDPIRTAYGWHLVEPLDRDTVKTAGGRDSLNSAGKPVLEAHARHILIRVQPTDTDIERTHALAMRVREEAAKGTDFATLVRRYSRYDGPAQPDGDVGFVSLGSLAPNIRAGLDSLETGEVSEVLMNQAGFNVFRVTDRKPEREYTIDEIRAELPEAVAELQFRDKYEAWLKTLRAKAQVEYRNL